MAESLRLHYQWIRTSFPPPRSRWSPDDMPDLSGKIALVTGGNTGIGREIVKALVHKNAKVYLAARSPEKAQRVIDELTRAEDPEKVGGKVEFLKLDLGDLACVRDSALEYKRRETRLDMLFLNAGIMCPPADELTTQGYDLTFGTNVIGHHLFLRHLYPLLLASPSTPASSSKGPSPVAAGPASRGPARIVWLSSEANYLAPHGRLDYETFTETDPAIARSLHSTGADSLAGASRERKSTKRTPKSKRRKVGMLAMYAQSKLAAIALSAHVAHEAATRGEDVLSFAVDPGRTRSEIFHRGKGWYWQLWEWLVTYPTPFGAINPLFAGTAPEAAEFNGKYIRPWARLGDPNSWAYDSKEQQQLCDWLDKQIEPFM